MSAMVLWLRDQTIVACSAMRHMSLWVLYRVLFQKVAFRLPNSSFEAERHDLEPSSAEPLHVQST